MILSWLSALLSRHRDRAGSPPAASPPGSVEPEPAPMMTAMTNLQAVAGATPPWAEATPAQAASGIPVIPPLDDPGSDEVDDDLLATFREEAPVDTAASLLAGTVACVDTDELVQDLRYLLQSL